MPIFLTVGAFVKSTPGSNFLGGSNSSSTVIFVSATVNVLAALSCAIRYAYVTLKEIDTS